MISGLFGSLLEELSSALHCPPLQPDEHNSCLIRLKGGQKVQLELDRSGDFLLIGADLGEVPPGKYRENLFKEALKANAMPYPTHGTLAYSKQSGHLILFLRVPIKDLRGAQIAALIPPFAAKALLWSAALQKGEIPSLDASPVASRGGGMFGLR